MDLKNRNVILRIVKPYQEARNHVYTGCIVGWDGNMLKIDGCVLNFGRASSEDPTGGLTISPRAVRWVPRERIQFLRELPDDVDPFDPGNFQVTTDGNVSHGGKARPDLLPD